MIPSLVAAIILSSRQTSADLASITSAQIVEAVGWLPTDTETLIVDAKPGALHQDLNPSTIASDIYVLPFFSMPDPDSGHWTMKYDYVVDGTSNYRFPHGLVLMPFDGCAILGMQPDQLSKAETLTKKMANHTGIVAGHPVFVIQAKMEEDNWTWYVTFDEKHMFSATDKSFITKVMHKGQT